MIIFKWKNFNWIIEARNPTVMFKLVDTLTFEVDAFGHPFYLKTLQGLGTYELATGLENNGSESKTIIWNN